MYAMLVTRIALDYNGTVPTTVDSAVPAHSGRQVQVAMVQFFDPRALNK